MYGTPPAQLGHAARLPANDVVQRPVEQVGLVAQDDLL
jgi:hypothetical protein